MSPYRLDYAWCTDKGRVRVDNEDAVSVLPSLGLVIVADGIGGASAGEVASRLAADVIGEHFRSRPVPPADKKEALSLLTTAVAVANRTIWRSPAAVSGTPRPG